ncbi:spore germination protein [Paenibacillus pinisoli]|uniref:Spore germination protein n=1 Tax=Paenibacillus pinisoli TaxID=1276110 RepID=A0A3A6P8D7_9BACL|nr:spore germination protein [Paenibacillus pinisoli]RJX36772.1 spore germination protein [Paenibacillus pinisoli]
MKLIKGYRRTKQQKQPKKLPANHTLAEFEGKKLSGSLQELEGIIDSTVGKSADLAIRKLHVFGRFPAVMYSFSHMVQQAVVNEDILKPFMHAPMHLQGRSIELAQLPDILLYETLYHGEVQLQGGIDLLIRAILGGDTVVAVEGMKEAFIIGTRSVEKRSIEQPATEQVIRGPREGFIESLGTNLALIRYRLQSTELRIDSREMGSRSKSKIAICYMDGITDPEVLKELDRRLSEVEIDGILDSGYLEQFIEDNKWSPFPQVQYTERPDKVAANLLEGRVAILVDGSPLALVIPTVFGQFYQTVEDYTERFLLMSAIRLARLVALIFSLVFPSLYVAIISFNPELIPTEFAVAVAGGRAGVPFPAVIEVLIMEVSMEVLREATIRLPQQVGGALSIVGVLVIGQAAVAAGFASPITVVIIALTTIGSFATPAYNAALALRLLRFPLIIMAGIFGLYGIMVGLIVIANHVLSLKSFGVPYLSPLVPGDKEGMKDLLIRAPIKWMKNRPAFLHPQDNIKLHVEDQAPSPSTGETSPEKR